MPELDTAPLGKLFLGTFEKSKFSMAIPPILELVKKHDFKSVVLFGIEVSGQFTRRAPSSRQDCGWDCVIRSGVKLSETVSVPARICHDLDSSILPLDTDRDLTTTVSYLRPAVYVRLYSSRVRRLRPGGWRVQYPSARGADRPRTHAPRGRTDHHE